MEYAPPDGGGGLGAAAAAAAAEGLFDADSVRDHEELLGQLESFLKVEERLALKKNFSDVLGRSLARKERGQVTLVVHCKHPKNFFNWIRKAQQDSNRILQHPEEVTEGHLGNRDLVVLADGVKPIKTDKRIHSIHVFSLPMEKSARKVFLCEVSDAARNSELGVARVHLYLDNQQREYFVWKHVQSTAGAKDAALAVAALRTMALKKSDSTDGLTPDLKQALDVCLDSPRLRELLPEARNQERKEEPPRSRRQDEESRHRHRRDGSPDSDLRRYLDQQRDPHQLPDLRSQLGPNEGGGGGSDLRARLSSGRPAAAAEEQDLREFLPRRQRDRSDLGPSAAFREADWTRLGLEQRTLERLSHWDKDLNDWSRKVVNLIRRPERCLEEEVNKLLQSKGSNSTLSLVLLSSGREGDSCMRKLEGILKPGTRKVDRKSTIDVEWFKKCSHTPCVRVKRSYGGSRTIFIARDASRLLGEDFKLGIESIFVARLPEERAERLIFLGSLQALFNANKHWRTNPVLRVSVYSSADECDFTFFTRVSKHLESGQASDALALYRACRAGDRTKLDTLARLQVSSDKCLEDESIVEMLAGLPGGMSRVFKESKGKEQRKRKGKEESSRESREDSRRKSRRRDRSGSRDRNREKEGSSSRLSSEKTRLEVQREDLDRQWRELEEMREAMARELHDQQGNVGGGMIIEDDVDFSDRRRERDFSGMDRILQEREDLRRRSEEVSELKRELEMQEAEAELQRRREMEVLQERERIEREEEEERVRQDAEARMREEKERAFRERWQREEELARAREEQRRKTEEAREQWPELYNHLRRALGSSGRDPAMADAMIAVWHVSGHTEASLARTVDASCVGGQRTQNEVKLFLMGELFKVPHDKVPQGVSIKELVQESADFLCPKRPEPEPMVERRGRSRSPPPPPGPHHPIRGLDRPSGRYRMEVEHSFPHGGPPPMQHQQQERLDSIPGLDRSSGRSRAANWLHLDRGDPRGRRSHSPPPPPHPQMHAPLPPRPLSPDRGRKRRAGSLESVFHRSPSPCRSRRSRSPSIRPPPHMLKGGGGGTWEGAGGVRILSSPPRPMERMLSPLRQRSPPRPPHPPPLMGPGPGGARDMLPPPQPTIQWPHPRELPPPQHQQPPAALHGGRFGPGPNVPGPNAASLQPDIHWQPPPPGVPQPLFPPAPQHRPPDEFRPSGPAPGAPPPPFHPLGTAPPHVAHPMLPPAPATLPPPHMAAPAAGVPPPQPPASARPKSNLKSKKESSGKRNLIEINLQRDKKKAPKPSALPPTNEPPPPGETELKKQQDAPKSSPMKPLFPQMEQGMTPPPGEPMDSGPPPMHEFDPRTGGEQEQRMPTPPPGEDFTPAFNAGGRRRRSPNRDFRMEDRNLRRPSPPRPKRSRSPPPPQRRSSPSPRKSHRSPPPRQRHSRSPPRRKSPPRKNPFRKEENKKPPKPLHSEPVEAPWAGKYSAETVSVLRQFHRDLDSHLGKREQLAQFRDLEESLRRSAAARHPREVVLVIKAEGKSLDLRHPNVAKVVGAFGGSDEVRLALKPGEIVSDPLRGEAAVMLSGKASVARIGDDVAAARIKLHSVHVFNLPDRTKQESVQERLAILRSLSQLQRDHPEAQLFVYLGAAHRDFAVHEHVSALHGKEAAIRAVEAARTVLDYGERDSLASQEELAACKLSPRLRLLVTVTPEAAAKTDKHNQMVRQPPPPGQQPDNQHQQSSAPGIFDNREWERLKRSVFDLENPLKDVDEYRVNRGELEERLGMCLDFLSRGAGGNKLAVVFAFREKEFEATMRVGQAKVLDCRSGYVSCSEENLYVKVFVVMQPSQRKDFPAFPTGRAHSVHITDMPENMGRAERDFVLSSINSVSLSSPRAPVFLYADASERDYSVFRYVDSVGGGRGVGSGAPVKAVRGLRMLHSGHTPPRAYQEAYEPCLRYPKLRELFPGYRSAELATAGRKGDGGGGHRGAEAGREWTGGRERQQHPVMAMQDNRTWQQYPSASSSMRSPPHSISRDLEDQMRERETIDDAVSRVQSAFSGGGSGSGRRRERSPSIEVLDSQPKEMDLRRGAEAGRFDAYSSKALPPPAPSMSSRQAGNSGGGGDPLSGISKGLLQNVLSTASKIPGAGSSRDPRRQQQQDRISFPKEAEFASFSSTSAAAAAASDIWSGSAAHMSSRSTDAVDPDQSRPVFELDSLRGATAAANLGSSVDPAGEYHRLILQKEEEQARWRQARRKAEEARDQWRKEQEEEQKRTPQQQQQQQQWMPYRDPSPAARDPVSPSGSGGPASGPNPSPEALSQWSGLQDFILDRLLERSAYSPSPVSESALLSAAASVRRAMAASGLRRQTLSSWMSRSGSQFVARVVRAKIAGGGAGSLSAEESADMVVAYLEARSK